MKIPFELAGIALAALLSENFILVKCLGLGVREQALREPKDAFRTGYSLTLVMVVTALLGWLADNLILVRFSLTYLRTLVFTLLALSVVAGLRRVIRACLPEFLCIRRESKYCSCCAALGVVLLISQRSYSLGAALVFALCGGIGATVVMVSYASLGEEVDMESCPKVFRGVPIRLITMGLMAMAMVGFYGLHLN